MTLKFMGKPLQFLRDELIGIKLLEFKSHEFTAINPLNSRLIVVSFFPHPPIVLAKNAFVSNIDGRSGCFCEYIALSGYFFLNGLGHQMD